MTEISDPRDYVAQQRSKSVQVYERKGRDLNKDTTKNARDIGQARLNHSRLNVFSALEPDDKEDNFKFKVPTPGALRLGIWPKEGLRIQMMNARGDIIADSEGSGNVLKRFKNIEKFEHQIEPGEYQLRITRPGGTSTSVQVPYALQVQVGSDHRKDFDTTEYKADPNKKDPVVDPLAKARQTAATRQGEMLSTMMTSGLDNLYNVLDKSVGLFATIVNRIGSGQR